jgi:5-methylcytosine-specific restriction endonuclease McrA
MINIPVLVLNQNYEPLNVCRARRALLLVYQGKAEMLENGYGFVHSVARAVPLPSVIRLHNLVRRPRPRVKLTRQEIFERDDYTCQYCGKQNKTLTLDHVVPRRQGGPHTWENLVSACIPCNHRKAGRTPEQAGIKLLRQPARPHNGRLSFIPRRCLETRHNWTKYLGTSQS